MIKTIFHIIIGLASVAEPTTSDESAPSCTPPNKRSRSGRPTLKKIRKSLNSLFKNGSICSVSIEPQTSRLKPMTPDVACKLGKAFFDSFLKTKTRGLDSEQSRLVQEFLYGWVPPEAFMIELVKEIPALKSSKFPDLLESIKV